VRIAIATDWFAPRRGGIETQLLRLARELASRGHHVDVLTPMPSARQLDGFNVRQLDVATMPRFHMAVSPALLPVLHGELRRGYDVVHAHVSVVSPVSYASAAVARSLGLPTVVTFHSVLRLKKYLLSTVNAIAGLRGSNAIWSAVSELVAGQLRDALGGADVRVLPNGIDLAFWNASRATVSSRASAPVTLVSTMRFHLKKRPRQLLRAFAHATSRSAAPARLLIVGDGPERRALERDVRELGLADGDVTADILGWLSSEELRSLYRDAQGFVSASTRESFGIAALEARAVGLPVIAMAAAGSSEFLADGANALLCEDDADLVRSLSRFIQDAELRHRLASAVTPLEGYDWSAVLAKHEATYQLAITRANVAAEAVAL
jgi:glycosyltransferase involved in cell wall biosynthesis